jgi:hypothetical protein
MYFSICLHRYVLTRWVEKMVPLRRLTTILMPHCGERASLRPVKPQRTSIVDWLKYQPDYCLYTKRIRPGLTENNRMKQTEFSKHVQNRWGLEWNNKTLRTMIDEKWWFGLVSRTFAKMCPTLGNVMGHATVGY